MATTVLLYGVMATSWNIVGGLAGQLDFAAFAYLGIGAYVSGTLFIRFNITPWFGMILGGMVASGFALLIGIPLFRFGIKEVWYALTTSALVEILKVAFNMWEKVGGPVERCLPYFSGSWQHMRFVSYAPFYYIMLAMLIIALYVNQRIVNSKLGYYLKAIGEDETATEVLGVDNRASKLKALVFYSFLIGMTGGIYANMYDIFISKLLSMVQKVQSCYIRNRWCRGITYGPLRLLFICRCTEFLRASLADEFSGRILLIYAVILVIVCSLLNREE